MENHDGALANLSHVIHKRLLWLLIASYALAAGYPALGLWIRDVKMGAVSVFGSRTHVSLSMLMLASLLLNAGLGVRLRDMGKILARPRLLGAGLAANLIVPIAFILVVTRMMSGWHNADEVQNILVGLALVASMPIAGSSTAWAQNADGELALSLGMVLFSTLLSPLTTPLALHSVGLMATGDYAEDLHELAAGGTGAFLGICVLAPSLIGIGIRRIIGEVRIAAAKPHLKLINSAILLTLNYSNASVSLPQAVADPDPDFLFLTLAVVVSLCAARVHRRLADRADLQGDPVPANGADVRPGHEQQRHGIRARVDESGRSSSRHAPDHLLQSRPASRSPDSWIGWYAAGPMRAGELSRRERLVKTRRDFPTVSRSAVVISGIYFRLTTGLASDVTVQRIAARRSGVGSATSRWFPNRKRIDNAQANCRSRPQLFLPSRLFRSR